MRSTPVLLQRSKRYLFIFVGLWYLPRGQTAVITDNLFNILSVLYSDTIFPDERTAREEVTRIMLGTGDGSYSGFREAVVSLIPHFELEKLPFRKVPHNDWMECANDPGRPGICNPTTRIVTFVGDAGTTLKSTRGKASQMAADFYKK